jgi:hypothetical protein
MGSWTHVNSVFTRKLVWPTLIGLFSMVAEESFNIAKQILWTNPYHNEELQRGHKNMILHHDFTSISLNPYPTVIHESQHNDANAHTNSKKSTWNRNYSTCPTLVHFSSPSQLCGIMCNCINLVVDRSFLVASSRWWASILMYYIIIFLSFIVKLGG